tara:strand:+ start:5565 stop:5852 length:288 start_codon:yes stop_codon:yes gene_type:complete
MIIETQDKTIDVFPIRRVRITRYPSAEPSDEFHRVCQKDITVYSENAIGLNQHEATLILDEMRHSSTDIIGNGKDFYMVRGNSLIPIFHDSFPTL